MNIKLIITGEKVTDYFIELKKNEAVIKVFTLIYLAEFKSIGHILI